MAKEIEISEKKRDNAEKQILEKIKNYDYSTVEYPIEVVL
jgi:hypothetical protein